MITRSISRARALSMLAALLSACDGCGDDGEGTADTVDSSESSAGETGTTDGPASGLLACPAGESCTIVLVAEAFDDRIDVFSARGPGPLYRGSIDVDLKPNPMGDNEGENLDEPYGMAVTDQGLAVLLGHYPMRQAGSLVLFPHELLAAQAEGSTLASSAFFAGGTFTAGVTDISFGVEEPIFVRAHPSGRLLVGVFDNDLFAPENEWTNPGQLLVVDPVSGEFGTRSLATIDGGSCAGAWSVVPLDPAMDSVGLACDGDEGVVILDVSGVGEGAVADAAAAIDGCFADILLPDRRVRYVAPDGDGGMLLVDSTPNYDPTGGKLWRFDAACAQVGEPSTLDQQYWEVREIVHLPNAAGPRWLMPIGRGTQGRGVHVLRDVGGSTEVCRTLDAELTQYWAGDDGLEVHPFALATTKRGDGVAIGAGPVDAVKDMPGYGRVLWLDIDTSIDPCDAGAVTSVIDLTASAPAVSPDDPATWRRGPNQIFVQQYG